MRTPPLTRCVGIGFALALANAPLLAEGARIVNAPGLPPFTNLQEAVDAANDGDTILVAGGFYEGFTLENKGLSIVGVPKVNVWIQGTVQVVDLPAGSTVLLSGLRLVGLSQFPVSGAGLVVTNTRGHVRVESCKINGGPGWNPHVLGPFGDGGTASIVSASARVAFSHCTISGGVGAASSGCEFGCLGGDGGMGVRVNEGTVACYECSIGGGWGGENQYGGKGGDACSLQGSWLFAAGSSFKGGNGGDGFCIFSPGRPGNGGAGLGVGSGSSAELLDDSCSGGSGGHGYGCNSIGLAGPGLGGPGTINQYPGASRQLESDGLGFDHSRLTIVVHGQPGDHVGLLVGTEPGFLFQPSLPGVQLMRRARVTIGPQVVPSGGMLVISMPLPDMNAQAAQVLCLQALCRDVLGDIWLSNPVNVLILDREAPPDCNGNAQSDLVDVVLGYSDDCGPNLVPDECDPDCDGNGTPDDCDLSLGVSADCNENSVPDRCDLAYGTSRDCNENGRPDECDIALGASHDKNANAIPDECEPRRIWWVDAAAPGGGNGSSAAPFQSLGPAMDLAIDDDEIRIRDGLYSGPANRDIAFRGRSVTVRSENGPAHCILDLQGIGRAFLVDSPAGFGPRIEGLTFLHGASPDVGGALKVTASSVVIRNCVFEACLSLGQGGAIWINSGRGVLEDCIFRDNRTATYDPQWQRGGAVHFSGWDSHQNQTAEYQQAGGRIVRCTFEGNASVSGGAINYFGYAPLIVSHCSFERNSATLSGGAIANRGYGSDGGSVRVDDCLFALNRAGKDGGAMWASTPLPQVPTILNLTDTTFVDNQALLSGGALSIQGGSSTRIQNCIAWANQASLGSQIALDDLGSAYKPFVRIDRSNVEGGIPAIWSVGGSVTWGAGNLDLDPQFADPDGPDGNPLTFADNDYRPVAGSPVNDAGDNALVPPDLNDIDGDGNTTEPTPLDLDLTRRFVEDLLAPNVGAGTPPLVDMGCYEHP